MKRHASKLSALVISGALFMTGCFSQETSTASMYGDWKLASANQAGTMLDLSGSKHVFSISLTEDGKANGSVACNKWHGKQEMEDGKLKLTVNGVTKRKCQYQDEGQAKLARQFPSLASDATKLNVSDNNLTLTLSNGDVWTFDKQS